MSHGSYSMGALYEQMDKRRGAIIDYNQTKTCIDKSLQSLAELSAESPGGEQIPVSFYTPPVWSLNTSFSCTVAAESTQKCTVISTIKLLMHF